MHTRLRDAVSSSGRPLTFTFEIRHPIANRGRRRSLSSTRSQRLARLDLLSFAFTCTYSAWQYSTAEPRFQYVHRVATSVVQCSSIPNSEQATVPVHPSGRSQPAPSPKIWNGAQIVLPGSGRTSNVERRTSPLAQHLWPRDSTGSPGCNFSAYVASMQVSKGRVQTSRCAALLRRRFGTYIRARTSRLRGVRGLRALRAPSRSDGQPPLRERPTSMTLVALDLDPT